LLAQLQRMAIPELTRVFGQVGLYLRPTSGISSELSGNMLGSVISLHYTADALDGPIRCLDAALPLGSASLSLVHGLFALEASADPDQLVHEIARVLKPEGVALLVGFNPWGVGRLRWRLRGARSGAHGHVDRMAADAGLEVVRRQRVGPLWSAGAQAGSQGPRPRWYDGLRIAELVVLRRRDVALTPLRKPLPAVSLRPGMSAGLAMRQGDP
jgi:SAM-dependent methyltransferase